MKPSFIIWIVISLFVSSSNTEAQAVLDQSQLIYNGGLSARNIVGYVEGQSFMAGISGTLTEIDIGFFGDINGVGILNIYSGEGFNGPLLQTENVDVVCSNRDTIMHFAASVKVVAGQTYTFGFDPGVGIPDPYGMQVGYLTPYTSGHRVYSYNSGTTWYIAKDFCFVFKTFILPDNISPSTLLSLHADTLSTMLCDSANGFITMTNTDTGAIRIDSVLVAKPFDLLNTKFPLSLSSGTNIKLPIRAIPQTSGAFSTQMRIFYQTSDTKLHDTIITLFGYAAPPVDLNIILESKSFSASAGNSLDQVIDIFGNLDSVASLGIGQLTLSLSLQQNTDILNTISIQPEFPGVVVTQPVITGDSINFLIVLPFSFTVSDTVKLVTVHNLITLSDSTQTEIKLVTRKLSPSSSFNCFTLNYPVFTSSFSLLQQCGDSTLMKLMRNQLPILLNGIYPNPATNIITLGYDLPKSSAVGITIYSVTGEKMKEIQQVQEESGHHETVLDLAGFADGTYFISVSACGMTERRMVQVVR
jgi:hypothetical protein